MGGGGWVEFIHLLREIDLCWAAVNAVMKNRFP
jgi:hypothetical protein